MISASLGTTLGILKIVGIVVAGAAASVGAIKDPRTEDKKKPHAVPANSSSSSGVLGVVIALSSQVVESAKAASDQAQSNARDAQLLNEIKRAVTRIETVDMDVSLVVPTANKAFSLSYLDDLSEWTNKLIDDNARATDQYHGVEVVTSTDEGPDVLKVGPSLLSALPTPSRHKQAAEYFSDVVPCIAFYRKPIDTKSFNPNEGRPDLKSVFKGGRTNSLSFPTQIFGRGPCTEG